MSIEQDVASKLRCEGVTVLKIYTPLSMRGNPSDAKGSVL